ncbi:MAG: PIG-L family deacetylase [Erythrobacter sp.]|nr:PIG-L family deacetylase [Erythrobacter sp.]
MKKGTMMIRTALTGAFAALALAPATQAETENENEIVTPQRVLVVLAHPDDELFMAPAIAALARQGAVVTLAYATQGEAGPGVSNYAPGEELADVRLQEAFCSGQELGAPVVITFNRGDGRLGVDAHHKDSPASGLLRDFTTVVPVQNLVLTWGPDGGYGHADHRMVNALTTQIVQAMPAAKRPRLLYVGIPSGSRPDVPQMAGWAETDPALLTETIAYTTADLEAAKAAVQCHVTQFDADTRAGMMPLFDATIWQGKVHFRPAF